MCLLEYIWQLFSETSLMLISCTLTFTSYKCYFFSYSLTSNSHMKCCNKTTRAVEDIILNQWWLIAKKEIGGIVTYSFFMLMMLWGGMKISLFLVWFGKWILYLEKKNLSPARSNCFQSQVSDETLALMGTLITMLWDPEAMVHSAQNSDLQNQQHNKFSNLST